MTFEFGGRAILYSLNFDRVLNDDWVVGVGYGSVSTEQSSGIRAGKTARMIPLYTNFYFLRDAGSFYATLGATWVTNSDQVKDLDSTPGNLLFPSSPFLLTTGLGYEYRSDAGFLARLTAYGILGTKVVPWGSVTLGYSF
jgi:hypothetical protein